MGKTIFIRRGYDIKLEGAAEPTISDVPVSDIVAIKPADFHHVVPKILLEPGAEVLAGQALFFDKNRPDLRFCSPVSGEVAEVLRGEKRRILEVRILPDKAVPDTRNFRKPIPPTFPGRPSLSACSKAAAGIISANALTR